jgi:hypothetical protein
VVDHRLRRNGNRRSRSPPSERRANRHRARRRGWQIGHSLLRRGRRLLRRGHGLNRFGGRGGFHRCRTWGRLPRLRHTHGRYDHDARFWFFFTLRPGRGSFHIFLVLRRPVPGLQLFQAAAQGNRRIFVNRTGVGLLFAHAQFG